jgi:hypothetical protein
MPSGGSIDIGLFQKSNQVVQDPIRYNLYHGLFKKKYVNNLGASVDIGISNQDESLALAIAIAPSNNQIMVVATNDNVDNANLQNGATPNPPYNKLFLSTNGGSSWTAIGQNVGRTGPTSFGNILYWYPQVRAIVFDPNNENRIWIGLGGFGGRPGQVPENRVFYSNDRGQYWTEVSLGLPQCPVHSLVYQRGSDDVIYAGTDAGVYRYDKANNRWECFNKGLPVSIVTDLEIDYCGGLLYAATYGRGIWVSPLGATAPEQITLNTTWETGTITHATNDIIVKSGKRLTVRGTLNMAKGKKITVEVGAELIVDGGIITNFCETDAVWQGIVVKGTRNQPMAGAFPTRNQGLVVTRNNARIEHARTAIESQNGGIVTASNTSFKNNVKDIGFIDYPQQQTSSFKNCQFTVDAGYRVQSNIDARISMWAVRGVAIQGCQFNNTITNRFPILGEHNGRGIFAIDADFIVEPLCPISVPYPLECTDPIRTSFTNFREAIRVKRVSGNYTFSVNKTDFNTNRVGIYSEGVNNMLITRNNFNINNQNKNAWHYGVLVDVGNAFRVEENNFTGPSTSFNANNNYTMGIVMRQTGANSNQVYKNTFTKTRLANLAEGNNNDPLNDQVTGLQYLCNEQNQNDYDVVALPEYYSQRGTGIRGFQGNPGNVDGQGVISAQNSFSNNLGGDDLLNLADRRVIYMWDSQLRHKPIITANVYSANSTEGASAPGCPTKFRVGLEPRTPLTAGDRDAALVRLAGHQANYQDLGYLYQSLLNGGNRDALVANIELDWSDDMWEMRNKLLEQSPNLTTDVLFEVAETHILPRAMLMEVLLANIKAAQDQKLLKHLRTQIPNPLTDEMIDLLMDVSEPDSWRKTLSMRLAKVNTDRTEVLHTLLGDALVQPTVNTTEVRELWTKVNTPDAYYAIAESHLSEGNYTEALAAAQSVAVKFPYYVKDQYNEHQDYLTVLGLKQEVLASGRALNELTGEELAVLEQITQHTYAAAAGQAFNLLNLNGRAMHDYEFHFPTIPTRRKAAKVANPMQRLGQLLTEVAVYPNPATDYLTFEYQLPEYVKECLVEISDFTGKKIKEVILKNSRGIYNLDTRAMAAGIYIYTIRHEGSILNTNKFSIIK